MNSPRRVLYCPQSCRLMHRFLLAHTLFREPQIALKTGQTEKAFAAFQIHKREGADCL